MSRSIPVRMTAEIDGDAVVPLIGLRLVMRRLIHERWPVASA